MFFVAQVPEGPAAGGGFSVVSRSEAVRAQAGAEHPAGVVRVEPRPPPRIHPLRSQAGVQRRGVAVLPGLARVRAPKSRLRLCDWRFYCK